MFESLGHYKILDRIGAGGMGEVYRARDTRLGRTVAIKVMAAQLAGDPDRRDRFVREARATAALSHPNIAALYEVGEDQGQLYLVFEFVPGETLSHVISGRPLHPRRAVDFAAQIADALAEAHAQGIVHRDIKSENVIITPKDKAKVLDFGLATWTTGGAERDHAADAATVMATAAGTTLGTVAYMSPEQALGERVDHRTDIFSLGIVLFEMLTGKLPFTGNTPTALALQIVQAAPAPPSTINRGVPPELDAVVAKSLAKSLENRYESAATMTAELLSVAAILDVRTEISESSSSPSATASVPRRRPYVRWFVLAVLLLSLLAAAWLLRDAIQPMWRRTMGPGPAPLIAVIPLELAGPDASQTYFADGLTEDLISRLGQTRGLKVLGRSATRDYRGRAPRDVARELGARVVLTGSVRPSGDAVKVSVELVDASDGTAIWSYQYTRDVKNIFAVQAEIAADVAQALRLTLQPTPSSVRARSRLVDQRAYDLYLLGRQATAERTRLAEAVDLFERAIAADPGLGEAFAGLAEALYLQTTFVGVQDHAKLQQRRLDAAERAHQLDPDLPQANLAVGLSTRSLAEALGFMRRAVELDPSFTEAFHHIGDQLQDYAPELAQAFFTRSLELDPRFEINRVDLAVGLIGLNRWDDARREIERMTPGALQDSVRVQIDIDEHRLERALAALAANPGLRSAPMLWLPYAVALQMTGRGDEARREGAELVRRFPTCEARATVAGLSLEHRQAPMARRIGESIAQSGEAESATPAEARCAVWAAAALNDAPRMADLLDRIIQREDLLRYWAIQISGETGGTLLRGRKYPFDRVMQQPAAVAAHERMKAAYARQREVAKTVLAGLP